MEENFLNQGFEYLNRLISFNRKIHLEHDVILEDIIEIDGNDLIIDGKGHTIDACGKTQIFKITGKNILIKNTIFKNALSKKSGAAIFNYKGNLTLTNCRFINNASSNGDGGAVCNWGGVLTIEGCDFTHNSSNKDGGAIFNGNTMTITNCKFSKNNSKRGASIFNKDKSTLTLNDTVFKRNNDSTLKNTHINNEIFNKGIININSFEKEYFKRFIKFGFLHCFSSNSKSFKDFKKLITDSNEEIILDFDVEFSDEDSPISLDIDNLVINGNNHTVDALAKSNILTVNSKNVTLKNINFKNSNSKESCLEITNQSSLNLINCSFENNMAENGGAINNEGKLMLNECNFENNVCEINGGAINNEGDMSLTDCNFKDNISFKYGGALNNCRFLKMVGCEFKSNLTEYGGAINNELSGLTNINKSSFKKNIASKQGGIIFNDGSVSIANSEFSKNISNKNCHLIYQRGDEDSELIIEYVNFSEKTTENNLIHLKEGFCLIKSCQFDVNEDYYIVHNQNAHLKYEKTRLINSNTKAILNSGNLSIRKKENMESAIKNNGSLNYLDEKLPKDWKGFTYLDNLIHSGPKKITLDCDILMHLSEQDFYEGGIDIDEDNLVIDGDGHSIDANNFSRIFLISSKNVIIKNIKFVNGKYFKNKLDGENEGGGAIYSMPNSSVDIKDCLFLQNKSRNSAGAILNKSKSFKIDNSNFENNLAKNRAGTILNFNSLIDLSSVRFINNYATSSGCVYNENSSFDLIHGVFYDNCADKAGVISNNDSFIKLNDCRFRNNSSNNCAGVILNYKNSSEFYNCSFEKNNSNGEGGVIFNKSGNLTLDKCKFTQNSSKENGGGIFNSESYLYLVDCNFTGNSAINRGGAIENNFKSEVYLRDCMFSKNSAEDGGTISNMKKCKLSLKNSTFENNNANDNGGAVYNFFGFVSVEGCNFSTNESKYAGAFDNYLGFVVIKKTNFRENNAKESGGAIFNGGMMESLEDCLFKNNASLLKGGAIYQTKSSSASISNSTFKYNKAYGNGGVGGAIFNNSHYNESVEFGLDLINCDFSDNCANDNGGAILNRGYINLNKCNFANNYTVKKGEPIKNDGRNVKISIKNTKIK